MGIETNWKSFVELTRAKAESHENLAHYWDKVHNILSLILIVLSALTTLFTLLPVNSYISSGFGGLTTIASAIAGSVNPGLKRQQQLEATRVFRALMLKMVRVETEREYEELWKDFDKELLTEPFLPEKYKVEEETEFCMSPEFLMVVAKKEADVRDMTSDLGSSINQFCS
jgi:hypothetical protein